MRQKWIKSLSAILCVFSLINLMLGNAQVVKAAPLTTISDVMSRVKASTASDHTIKFRTPTGVDASTDTIKITFPAGFNLSTIVFGDVDLSHGASTGAETEETLAATAASGAWGFGLSGQAITFTAPTNATTGEITANDYVIIEIGTNAAGPGTHQITNPSAGNSLKITIDGTFGDTGYYAVAVITDDQIVINGTTDATLIYTISSNVLNLGTLNVASITTGTVTMTASTNAAGGYEIKYYGDTLKYGTSFDITAFNSGSGTAAASSPGTEQFGLRVSNVSGGSGAGYGQYTGQGATSYALKTSSSATSQELVARSTIPSATTTYTIEYGANISGNTEPGAYTTTHTWICTGIF